MIVPATVYMLRMSHHPVSMWYAGRTYESWTKAGYEVNIVEAVTPETMKEELKYVGFEFDIKRGGQRQRPFTEAEKAVFYSHAKILRLAKANENPSIILEHDAVLRDGPIENFDITNFDACPLCKTNLYWPAVAYWIKKRTAKYLLEHMVSQVIDHNYDAYLWKIMHINKEKDDFNPFIHYVNHEKDPILGNTLDHDGDE